MPVKRYDDLEEAERDLWIDSSDPSLGERIRRVWSFGERFAKRAERGVRRIRIGPSESADTPDSSHS